MSVTPKTYDNILTKGLESALANTQIQDGKLRYTTDTGNVYLDIAVQGTTPARVKISDVVQGLTEEQIGDIIAPLPKLYLASDTCRLYVYHSTKGWVDVSGAKLSETTEPDAEQNIWFSENSEEQPSYDDTFTYNSNTKNLSVSNITTEVVTSDSVETQEVITSEVNIDGMAITTTVDSISGDKITNFAFPTANAGE